MKSKLNFFLVPIFAILTISCAKDKNKEDKDLISYPIVLNNLDMNMLSPAKQRLVNANNAGVKVSFNEVTNLAVEDHLLAYNRLNTIIDAPTVNATNSITTVNNEASAFQQKLQKVQLTLDSLSLEISGTDYLETKVKYENAIKTMHNNKEMDYHQNATTILHMLDKNQMQCFSGIEMNLILNRKQFTGKDFRSKNLVVIISPNHGKPGIFVKENGAWYLFSVETTATGDAIQFEGGIQELANKPYRIITADLYQYINLFTYAFKTQEEEDAIMYKALKISAEKYGLNLEAMELMVERSKKEEYIKAIKKLLQKLQAKTRGAAATRSIQGFINIALQDFKTFSVDRLANIHKTLRLLIQQDISELQADSTEDDIENYLAQLIEKSAEAKSNNTSNEGVFNSSIFSLLATSSEPASAQKRSSLTSAFSASQVKSMMGNLSKISKTIGTNINKDSDVNTDNSTSASATLNVSCLDCPKDFTEEDIVFNILNDDKLTIKSNNNNDTLRLFLPISKMKHLYEPTLLDVKAIFQRGHERISFTIKLESYSQTKKDHIQIMLNGTEFHIHTVLTAPEGEGDGTAHNNGSLRKNELERILTAIILTIDEDYQKNLSMLARIHFTISDNTNSKNEKPSYTSHSFSIYEGNINEESTENYKKKKIYRNEKK